MTLWACEHNNLLCARFCVKCSAYLVPGHYHSTEMAVVLILLCTEGNGGTGKLNQPVYIALRSHNSQAWKLGSRVASLGEKDLPPRIKKHRYWPHIHPRFAGNLTVLTWYRWADPVGWEIHVFNWIVFHGVLSGISTHPSLWWHFLLH